MIGSFFAREIIHALFALFSSIRSYKACASSIRCCAPHQNTSRRCHLGAGSSIQSQRPSSAKDGLRCRGQYGCIPPINGVQMLAPCARSTKTRPVVSHGSCTSTCTPSCTSPFSMMEVSGRALLIFALRMASGYYLPSGAWRVFSRARGAFFGKFTPETCVRSHWARARPLFACPPPLVSTCRWAIDGLAGFHGEARLRRAAARILDST